MLLKINNLKRIPRTGWFFCSMGPGETEDVAQHIFEVTAMALLLSRGLDVNREKLLKLALVHDWPEAVVGDFCYTALPFLGGKEVKNRMEDRAIQSLLEKERDLIELWREYRDNNSLEAKLVHFCDYLSILVEAIVQAERGNRSPGLKQLCENVFKDLDPYLELFPQFEPLVTEIKRRLPL